MLVTVSVTVKQAGLEIGVSVIVLPYREHGFVRFLSTRTGRMTRVRQFPDMLAQVAGNGTGHIARTSDNETGA